MGRQISTFSFLCSIIHTPLWQHIVLQSDSEDGVYNFALNEEEISQMPKHIPYKIKTRVLSMEESVSIFKNSESYRCSIQSYFISCEVSCMLC